MACRYEIQEMALAPPTDGGTSVMFNPFLAHSAGMVKLQVALNGNVISNAVIFEYRQTKLSASQRLVENEVEEDELPDLLNIVDNNEDILKTNNHSLYLCNDASCQRILKTILLQKFDDLIAYYIEDSEAAAKRPRVGGNTT